MKAILLVVSMALLSGCDVESTVYQDQYNHGFGTWWDYESPVYGIKYRIDYTFSTDVIFDRGYAIDQALKDAAQCLGVEPKVRETSIFVITPLVPEPYDGYHYNNTGLILVKPFRGYAFTEMATHEFVHELVVANYGYSDNNHTSGCYPHGTVAQKVKIDIEDSRNDHSH